MTRTKWLKHLRSSVVDLLYPPNCLACGEELDSSDDRIEFCLDCRQEMLRGDWPVCVHCASRVPKFPGTVQNCGHCRGRKLWFDRTLALGDYDGLLREQCLTVKIDRSERVAQSLGRLMAEQFRDDLLRLHPDAIVPIPMHVRRRLARGTNPPAALSAVVGRSLRIPAHLRLLERHRNTPPQIGLSNPARFRNVRGELQVRADYQINSPHILLVDDILTTGATCSEAARVLKHAGAAEVTVLVVARTPSF